jgi:Protein of unknown function (DUF4232)
VTTSTNARHRRRVLPLALVAAAGTLALTACGGASGASAAGAAGVSASASASGAASSAAPHSSSPAAAGGSGSGGGAAAGSPISSGGSDADSNSYAYSHPCPAGQLRVKVSYDAALGATKRLIAVTDTGRRACGLSYYPVVAVDNSSTIGTRSGTPQTIQPAVPGGLGGPPAYALHAGHTAYAVVDLDPSHRNAGASRAYDQLSVVASDNLPDADTIDTPIVEEGGGTGNPHVKAPFLGLYENTVTAADSSANPVNG